MKEVKCPLCFRFRKVGDDVILPICSSCQVRMEVTRKFCSFCGEELKEDQRTLCGLCKLPKYSPKKKC